MLIVRNYSARNSVFPLGWQSSYFKNRVSSRSLNSYDCSILSANKGRIDQHNNGVRQQRMGRFVDRIALQSQRLCQIQLLVKCLYYRISREKSVAVRVPLGCRCSVFLSLMPMGRDTAPTEFRVLYRISV